MPLEEAFVGWRGISGLEVLSAEEATAAYHANTLGTKRSIAGALRPKNAEDVQKIVAIANTHRIPLHAFSTGHDWGFGSSLPVADNCVILDLSGMKRVIECNEALAYVTLEPGVTQQDLFDYFEEHSLPFMVPTTGGGPSCSIIGNALERGYGVTPDIDHFGAVMSLEAVLPNGELYRSAFHAFGGVKADPVYKWKVGPYLDGLFAQGNIGVVTRATIALVRKSERISQFVAFIDEQHMEDAVRSIAKTKERLGSLIGGLNLMNMRRVLSMVESKNEWLIKGVIPEKHLLELSKRRHVSDWVVLIGIYCPRDLERGVKRSIHREFKYALHSVFMNRPRAALVGKVLRFMPNFGFKKSFEGMQDALDVLEGIPSEVALPLAYLKNPHPMPAHHLHPDRDGSGLIWYTPVLPVDATLVREFVRGVTDIFLSEQLEPLITLTAISQRAFASNIPIVFNRDDAEECERARRAFKRMLQFARELGTFPDRLDIDTIRELYDHAEGPCFELTEKIKDAVDPNRILNPGRYGKAVK
ncbi:MAG TPA: FAD-binding oxidoreductase [Candidatus Paceibacterota bacterium]|nr:FAD-binding oxidoreductase [Candidatus Paceibacterota bacterium]